MIARQHWLAVTLGATLLLTRPHTAAALGDTTVKADPCSIAAGTDARNNTVTCNFGLTPEQLKELTTARCRRHRTTPRPPPDPQRQTRHHRGGRQNPAADRRRAARRPGRKTGRPAHQSRRRLQTPQGTDRRPESRQPDCTSPDRPGQHRHRSRPPRSGPRLSPPGHPGADRRRPASRQTARRRARDARKARAQHRASSRCAGRLGGLPDRHRDRLAATLGTVRAFQTRSNTRRDRPTSRKIGSSKTKDPARPAALTSAAPTTTTVVAAETDAIKCTRSYAEFAWSYAEKASRPTFKPIRTAARFARGERAMITHGTPPIEILFCSA